MALVKLRSTAMVGAELFIVTLMEMLEAVEFVQLLAVAFCLQEMLSPFAMPGIAERFRVLLLPDETNSPFLYQVKFLMETFSVSLSGSVNVPLVQLAMELTPRGEETLGWLSVGRLSG